MSHVLVIDDDAVIRRIVQKQLEAEGLHVVSVADARAGLAAIEEEEPGAIILDLILPDASGMDLLPRFREERPHVPVVMLTGSDDVNQAVACMRLGATDFVHKPFDRARLVASVRNALTQGSLRNRIDALEKKLHGDGTNRIVIGESSALRSALALLDRAAASNVSVLLEGQSGTGKEVAARRIHDRSERRSGPFVAVNCGAIPEGLMESELFGHMKGAFTGADRTRAGHFEEAHGGTILLDEIGELRYDLQVKLLRALQEGVVQRVGSSQVRSIDVRVIAATNRDLKACAADGTFREDLYYRLAVFPIVLPALKDRDGDILLLAQAFLERFAERHGRDFDGIDDAARAALLAHDWPGNVRELENVIERAVILEPGRTIGLRSLPDVIVGEASESNGSHTSTSLAAGPAADGISGLHRMGASTEPTPIRPLDDVIRDAILRALESTGWNVKEAAQLLEIGRATMYRRMERYGLTRAPQPA